MSTLKPQELIEIIVKAANAYHAMRVALHAYQGIDFVSALSDAFLLNKDQRVAVILERLSGQLHAARALETSALALVQGKK